MGSNSKRIIKVDKRIGYLMLTTMKTGNFLGKYILLKRSKHKEQLNRLITFELTEKCCKKNYL